MGCGGSTAATHGGGETHTTSGTWVCLKNKDMCGQGDVDGIGDWKAEGKSLDDLRRICEERGHMAFSIDPSGRHFKHCAFKKFDYQLTAQHCTPSPGYTCASTTLESPASRCLPILAHPENAGSTSRFAGMKFTSSRPPACVARAARPARAAPPRRTATPPVPML